MHEIDARTAADVEHTPPRGTGKFDEALQVVELFEVVLIQIREKAGRADLVARDRQIVNVRVPVRAHPVPKVRFVRTGAGHDTLL